MNFIFEYIEEVIYNAVVTVFAFNIFISSLFPGLPLYSPEIIIRGLIYCAFVSYSCYLLCNTNRNLFRLLMLLITLDILKNEY